MIEDAFFFPPPTSAWTTAAIWFLLISRFTLSRINSNLVALKRCSIVGSFHALCRLRLHSAVGTMDGSLNLNSTHRQENDKRMTGREGLERAGRRARGGRDVVIT